MTASLKCPLTTLMAMGSTDPADLTDLGDLISMKDLADLEDLISPADPARRPDRLEVSKMRSKAMAQNH